MKLESRPFGTFNPAIPDKIPGLFSCILSAPVVDIDAPVQQVWEVMTGFEHYPEWNPCNRFFTLDDQPLPGHGVTMGPSWGPFDIGDGEAMPEHDFEQHEVITVYHAPHCLSYAVLSRLLNAERTQYLESLANGQTRYHSYERMSGALALLTKWRFSRRMLAGFVANGQALKRRAESL